MASLTGQLVAETYKALLKTIDNDILTASEKQITDGLGGGSNVFIDSQGFLRANKYKVTNGLATQFLKADGSLDANTYLTGITSSQIITALGYTPVPTTRTLTINGTTYDLSANRSWTVAGTAAIWGNITGTLSNQTDLQTALNAKFNNPTGTISQYIRGDGSLATFPTLPGGLPTGGTAGQILAKIDATDYNAHWIDNFATQTKNEVKLGATLAKGTAVYVSGSTGGSGTNMIVMAASNASEALSSKTFGLLETGGATNDFVKCVTFGLIAGLDTSTAQAGDPVWLGVNGALLFGVANKPVAPANMVYIGVVTRVQSNNGEIFVNVQNGFEIEELHDVLIQSKANNQGLFYESSTGLWKNKSIATVLGYTPQAQLDGTGFVKASGTTISYDNSTYLTTADAASTYQLLTNLSTDLTASATKYPSVNAVIAGLATKQNQLNGTGLVRMDGTTVSYDNNSYVTGSGSVGYISSWNATTGLTNSSLFQSSGSIGLNITNVNYSAYGRAFTGASFAASSFGYEIASGATADGGLLGGLAYVLISNDASRRIGAKIESNVVGTTATNLGANLRFYVKADNAAIAEIARMTASGVTFYSGITATSFIKTGGTSNEYLRADGSVNVITGDIISGSGTAGYIAKFGSSAVIASSNLFESGANIGFGTITLNYGSYGRAFTGAGFGSTAFGFEAVTGSTTNGGLIGGLSLVIAGNDSTRRIGSAIQSYISGATSTHQGADLRFFVKPDNAVLLEVVRMTSAGITFNKDLTAANITATTFVKSGGLSTQFLMADGSVSTLSSPVTGSGSAGYIPKWTTAANIGSSIIYEDTSIGIAYTTPNRGGYGRTLTGAAFGSASFGFEAVSNTTTNGGLIGGLSFIVNQNDSSRIVGSAIQSNLVGTTATNYGADLRFFAKADGVFTIAEVARITSAGLRVYGTIVKDGGTSSQFLKADGSIDANSYVTGGPYLALTGGTLSGQLISSYNTGGEPFVNAIFRAVGGSNIGGVLVNGTTQAHIRFQVGSTTWDGAGSKQWQIRVGNGLGEDNMKIYSWTKGGDTMTILNNGNTTIHGTLAATNLSGTNTGDQTLAGLGGVGGTGTINYLPKFTASSTIGNSLIFDDGTNVGIGTTTMYGKFSVSSGSTQGIRIDTNAGSAALSIGGTGLIYIDAPSVVGGRFAIFDNGNTSIGSNIDSGFKFFVNGSAKISTSVVSQDYRFEGTGYITYNTNNVGTNTFIIRNFGTSVLSFNTSNEATFASSIISGASVTIGTGGNYATGSIYSDGSWGMIFRARQASPSNAEYRWARSNDAELMRISPSGGLQIGTTPDAGFRLDVAGTGRFSNSDNADLIRYNASGVNTNFATKIISGANDVLTFRRQHSSAGALDIMSLGYNGYVGIGVTTPGAFLHVKGQFESNYGLILEGTFGNGHSYGWRTNGGNSDVLSLFSVTLNSRLAVFGYSEALIATGGSTRFYVTGGGSVGIGTTNPLSRLSVEVPSASNTGGIFLDMTGGGGGSIVLGLGASVGPYIVGNTNPDGTARGAYSGSRMGFNAGGFSFDYSTTTSGTRSWSTYMSLTSSGNLLVGRTADSGERIQVTAGNATAIRIDTNANYNAINIGGYGNISVDYPGIGGGRFYLDGGGALTIRQSMTATSFFESSDFRLKTLIENNPIIHGIEHLEAKLYEKDGKLELGYFAQDAEKIMPYAVTKNADGFLNLSYREVHTAKIARLEKRVAELEKQLNLN